MSSEITKVDTTKLAVMKIHDFPRGPYPARVRIALGEKGLQSRVQFNMVDLYKGEHKNPTSSPQRITPVSCQCSN